MAESPNVFVKLATELIKYYVEKSLGEGALAILVKSLADLIGESASEKLNSFSGSGRKGKFTTFCLQRSR